MHIGKKYLSFLICFVVFLEIQVYAASPPVDSKSAEKNSFFIERRKDQSPKEGSHFIVPYYMKVPGIGDFWGVSSGFDNLFETETDFYMAAMTGDIEGYVASLGDIPLFYDFLSLNVFQNDFSKASIETYDRGMESGKDAMRSVIANKVNYRMYMLNLKFFEKRLQFYLSSGSGSFRIKSLVDKDGEKIADLNQKKVAYKGYDMGAIFDFTDDRKDPRKGLRLEIRRGDSPREDEFSSNYYLMDYNLTFYLPLGTSTLATNIFKSDAVVRAKGVTDRDVLLERIGRGHCDVLSEGSKKEECLRAVTMELEQAIAQNKYGKASSLGGTQFLRSYPQGRFYGAHSLFFGSELRWNLTQEFTPYDLLFLKGVRTNIQLAFFAERGTVADQEKDLGKIWRHSYGTGVRLTLDSGFVFRFDVAGGEEGFQTQLFLSYPWGLYL